MAEKHIDEVTGIETTGHEWDGVRELNNPLPNWWRWILYASIVWSIGYWIVYPSWPLISSYSAGVIGYSSRAEVAVDMAAAKERQKVHLDKLEKASLQDIRTDSELLNFALAGGRSAFNVNCSQCHGSGAQGFKGYPNLNDDEWLWGGKLADITTTIRFGIRASHEESRSSEMPAFGVDEMLDAKQIDAVADYVLSLTSGSAATGPGAEIFKENCVACHGDKAQGDKEQGAPSLKDAVWLYGGDKATVVQTINGSRKGVMPAWAGRLDEATIKSLAVYVHSLGGGE